MTRTTVVAGAALLAVFTLACSSPGEDGSGTTGHTIRLKTRLVSGNRLEQAHPNALGWQIQLSQAYLSIGSLYYHSGEPLLSLRSGTRQGARRGAATPRPRSGLATLADWLVPSVHAHPGHYQQGAALGQMLEPTTVELVAGGGGLADGEGTTGLANSARFSWQSPAAGPLASALKGQVVLTRGTASKGSVVIHFIAKANVIEVRDGDGKAEVAGCSLGPAPGQSGVEFDADGTVTLTLLPMVWFDQVDFSYVARGTAGAPLPDAEGHVDLAGTLAWQGFIRGVKKGTAYQFSYQSETK